jgi:hypothetical protein
LRKRLPQDTFPTQAPYYLPDGVLVAADDLSGLAAALESHAIAGISAGCRSATIFSTRRRRSVEIGGVARGHVIAPTVEVATNPKRFLATHKAARER